ncbi:MAG: NAD(P)H-dependent oxidoreductase [Bacteroidota bacterium]
MKNILAFAGSNSKNSINKRLATYAAHQIEGAETTVIDLNDFELPMYGIDLENEHGIPDNAHRLLDLIKNSEGIVLSLAEHNGSYAAVFKNAYDWMSRIDNKLWSDVPMLLMATSPGGRGGASVLNTAANGFKHLGGNVVATFSLPSFGSNFSEVGITDSDLNIQLNTAIATLTAAI